MRTTILAYAIAFMGLIMIGGGGCGAFSYWSEQRFGLR